MNVTVFALGVWGGQYREELILNITVFFVRVWLKAIYMVSQEKCAILRESVPYVKLYRYNPKHLYPKLNGYGDNGQRNLKL